jgi:hypothetical protein
MPSGSLALGLLARKDFSLARDSYRPVRLIRGEIIQCNQRGFLRYWLSFTTRPLSG